MNKWKQIFEKNNFWNFIFYLESLCPPVSTKTDGQTKYTMPASFTLKMSYWRAKNNNKNFCPPVNRKLAGKNNIDPLPVSDPSYYFCPGQSKSRSIFKLWILGDICPKLLKNVTKSFFLWSNLSWYTMVVIWNPIFW